MGPPPPRRVDDLSQMGQREFVPFDGGEGGCQEGVGAREEEIGCGGGQVGSSVGRGVLMRFNCKQERIFFTRRFELLHAPTVRQREGRCEERE